MRIDSTPYYHVGEIYPWEKLIDEFRQEARLVDEAGFTGMWLAEHHFHWDGWYTASPNPILMGAALALESDRLRVGQCGVILPDWHPIRVAEDIALLDQLTKGRADFGIARGFNNRASIQFRADADRRDQKRNYALFAECLDIIIGAWTEEAFSYQGEFYTVPEPGWKETNPLTPDPRYHAPDGELKALGIQPKPYQKPHPPIWQMSDSIRSHQFAGARGIGAMCMSLSIGKIKEAWSAYREAASQVKSRPAHVDDPLAVVRPTYVAKTMEEAIADVRWGANLLDASGSVRALKAREAALTDDEMRGDDSELDALDFQLRHDLVLVGPPDHVADQIERLRSELNCQHLVLFLNFPGLSFEKVMRSLDLFGEQVMPRFRTTGASLAH
ncbi:MAG: LLM class flavin-dependent oxidoreductase [Chloroflexi bacterium]|nr:LLM class flavin-dependent oxidoreductase [Chloroflexota bacterium]